MTYFKPGTKVQVVHLNDSRFQYLRTCHNIVVDMKKIYTVTKCTCGCGFIGVQFGKCYSTQVEADTVLFREVGLQITKEVVTARLP